MSSHPNFQTVKPGPLSISILMTVSDLRDLAILPGHVFPAGSQFLDHIGRLFFFEDGAVVEEVSLTRMTDKVSAVVLRLQIEKKLSLSKTPSPKSRKERQCKLPVIQQISNEVELAKLLIKAQTEYITMLHAELDELVPYAAPHNWQSSRYLVGLAYRANIENIKSLLHPQAPSK